jgi:Ser/Thr protein kinase RdoA (MazF antagonist)
MSGRVEWCYGAVRCGQPRQAFRRGLSASHPSWARELVRCATQSVEAAYSAQRLPRQVIRGDGPEIMLTETKELAGVIDWGGVRYGSVADDIGCWTLHLGCFTGAYQDIQEEFLRGYIGVAQLTHEERTAIPLFQHLRLASRVCYVTDRNTLANVRAWLLAWQAERL